MTQYYILEKESIMDVEVLLWFHDIIKVSGMKFAERTFSKVDILEHLVC